MKWVTITPDRAAFPSLMRCHQQLLNITVTRIRGEVDVLQTTIIKTSSRPLLHAGWAANHQKREPFAAKVRVSYPFVGYLFLLLAFALLGLFIVALAYRSGWAAVAGVALGCSLVAAVVGFREGAVKLAQSRREGDPRHNVSIFSEPLRQEEVDQYYVNYRGGRRRAQLAVALRASRPNQSEAPEAVVPSRLSA